MYKIVHDRKTLPMRNNVDTWLAYETFFISITQRYELFFRQSVTSSIQIDHT